MMDVFGKMRVPDHAAIFPVRQNHRFKQYVKGAGVKVCIEVSK